MTKLSIKIKSNKIKALIFAFIVALLLILLYFKNPKQGGIFPPCPFLFLTGFYCPGCGTLRGIHALVHGQILRAVQYNILMVISIPFVIYLLLEKLGIEINGRLLIKRKLFSKTFYKILLGVIILYWIFRNIPLYPFTLLAPR